MEEEIIIKQIIESANIEARKTVNKAVSEAQEIDAKNSNAEKEKAERKFEIQKSRILKLISSDIEKAEFEARSAELIERKKYIEIVKEKVKQKILDLESAEYVKVISGLLEKYKNEPDAIVVLPEKCFEETKKVVSSLGMNFEKTDEFDSGIIVKCGQIEYNYDFDANMEYLNESIEKTIDKILFN